jgi:hypothetical protein
MSTVRFSFKPLTAVRLDTNVLRKLRFMPFFVFVAVKTAFEVSVTKTAPKDRRNIKIVTFFMLVAVVSAFEASVTKTASEKRFGRDGLMIWFLLLWVLVI